MKSLFKFCAPKSLFFLLVTNTGIRPAEIATAVIAAEELTVLVVMGTAAIHEMLVRYGQRDKIENEVLLVDVPGTGVPIESITVAGKSDEEVVAEVTQVVATAIGMEHDLSKVDQNKLDQKLRSQKLRFTNIIADSRSWGRAEHRFSSYRTAIDQIKSSNREKGRILGNQVVDIFILKNVTVRLPENLPGFQKDIQTVKRTFVDCNSPNLVRRIEARIHLSYLVKLDPDLFGDIREVACNLQARYFDKDKLVDISYDRRLAETMWMLFRDFSFYWGEKELEKFVGVIKRDNLDCEDSFEHLYRRISGQLSAEKKRQNKEYQPIAKWGKGRFFTHDRHKQILNESYNGKLFEVAVLCERGQFDEARAIAKKFNEDPMMKCVIGDYRRGLFKVNLLAGANEFLQKVKEKRLQAEALVSSEAELKIATDESLPKDPISLAPDSDSPSANQPISDIAPPPLPPGQKPDRDEEQEQDSEQAKKKDSHPVPPEGRNEFSDQEAQLKHNWSKRKGHMEKTPKNEKLVHDVANDPECYFGSDKHENHCYAKILEDGKQVWTEVRYNKIKNWGINEPGNIKKWNSETGFKALKPPKPPGKSWKPNL